MLVKHLINLRSRSALLLVAVLAAASLMPLAIAKPSHLSCKANTIYFAPNDDNGNSNTCLNSAVCGDTCYSPVNPVTLYMCNGSFTLACCYQNIPHTFTVSVYTSTCTKPGGNGQYCQCPSGGTPTTMTFTTNGCK
jgi:hypothetical protein